MRFFSKAIFYSLTFFSILVFFTSCSNSNIKIEDSLKKHFDDNKVEGTFAIYNNAQGNFNIYNLARYKDSSFQPASTFKIANSLIGLQTGKITNDQMMIPWDGIKRKFDSWNQDLTMEQAFKFSALPYYQEVARRIGPATMQMWLDSLSYGTKKINGPIDSFWIDNSLKITPDEELGFVKKLYFHQLPFNKTTMDIVKKVMVQENNSNYTLAYKTGWGYKEDGKALGWIVGWIEENKHPSFFVLNVEGANDTNMFTVRKNILMACLTDLGYLKGKK
ncbi:MAG: class D beta-lactamase [Chitinophagaceae bacterium]|nr:class D beta-lactamase [Chitinophagaceae bacterium]